MPAKGGICSVEGCTKPVHALGMCAMHYRRVRLYGDPGGAEPLLDTEANSKICSVDGCDRPVLAKGLCNMHYQRNRKHGSPGEADPRRALNGAGYLTKDGYRILTVDGEHIREHRLMMELFLGRPLLPSEEVHHLNGQRADNRMDNFELWSTSQPPGQRVVDKVEWATELLRLYAPERLTDDLQ